MSRNLKKGLEARLNLLADRILKNLNIRKAVCEIVLLGGDKLGLLKARFGLKKKGQVADILAFPEPPWFPHPEERGKRRLGEVYLNRDLPEKRLRVLLVHGILHLLGYTHERKGDIVKMERMEKKLTQQIADS